MTVRHSINRRTLLVTGSAGAGALALAGCGLGVETCDVPAAGTAPPVAGGQQLAVLSDIEVGAAAVVRAPGCGALVVARPTGTTAVAFSAVCTHHGVIVEARGRQLRCPAHDALFNATTGAVEQGPAERPLAEMAVSVVEGRVLTA
jgi:nitrite reductase/ring-hydroxylating ferredoxin subunit